MLERRNRKRPARVVKAITREFSAYAKLAEVWKGDPLAHPPLDALVELRNTAVAHFSPEPYRAVLAEETEVRDIRWAEGVGPTMGNFYFEFADEIALHSVLGTIDDEATFWRRYETLIRAMNAVLVPLHAAGANLIAAATKSLGAKAERL